MHEELGGRNGGLAGCGVTLAVVSAPPMGTRTKRRPQCLPNDSGYVLVKDVWRNWVGVLKLPPRKACCTVPSGTFGAAGNSSRHHHSSDVAVHVVYPERFGE